MVVHRGPRTAQIPTCHRPSHDSGGDPPAPPIVAPPVSIPGAASTDTNSRLHVRPVVRGDNRAGGAGPVDLALEAGDGSSCGLPTGRRTGVSRFVRWIFVDQPGWITSLLVHLLVLLILGLIVIRLPSKAPPVTIRFAPEDEPLDVMPIDFKTDAAELPEPLAEEVALLTEPMATPAAPEVALPRIADVTPESWDAQLLSSAVPSGLAGRGRRRAMATQLGATAASESAVDRALVWLAAHQRRDGSWSFDLSGCRCPGCSNEGMGKAAFNGATALAILPFLGAGQTHERGYHRATVEDGLLYLIEHQGRNGSFYEPTGRMYSHGIAALALCEALAMTNTDPGPYQDRYRKQKRLRRAAQRAIDFVIEAQHPAGGWRYRPKMRGDTSVVGWQAMALQSAKLASLRVSQKSLDKTSNFLDSVQYGRYGGMYGYMHPAERSGTTAVGLLTRMYLGWKRDHPGILEGIEYLNQLGPSSNNVYYNYYATQVLHHDHGEAWEAWHPTLRDFLVEQQSEDGHESGSWYFEGDFGSQVGGRLYITAMATMMLEIYYRHMPVYRLE